MPRKLTRRAHLAALAIAWCLASVVGCATWQGPRIDPTGERLFVWPNEPPAVAPGAPLFTTNPFSPAPVLAPPPGATVIAPAPPAPIVQPLPSVVPSVPFGNLLAPPIYSDPPAAPVVPAPFIGAPPPVPLVPTAPVPAGQIPAGPTSVLPPPPVAMPGLVAPLAVVVPAGREHLRVMPNGLVAPVGSEMLLKAGVVSPEGNLVANQRVDWSVARNGVGQFSELGFRDLGQFWGFFEAPQKIDDWSATTTTAVVPITLNSSTPNPYDDVPIFRGESWVTVTSATEGMSVVTAYAPAVDTFNQAGSTIYWIDAQWVFPQSVVVPTGRPHTLTTTLMRRTDGAPLAGWIVRYDVSGGAALGYEGGNSVEATTDAAGRASVEVSPKDAGGGVINVGVTIIRPETAVPAAMPRLELGRGAATITWSAVAAPAPVLPAPPGPGVMSPPLPLPPNTSAPPPSLPPTTTQPAPPPAPAANTPAPDPYVPPAAAATGKPRLEVTLRAAGPEQVAVGEYVSFDLTVLNRGDGIARHIQIDDQFDRGLSHLKDTKNEHRINYSGMRDLPPNESDTLRLTFQVIDGGSQCHVATVTADGADAVTRRACVAASQAALEIKVSGPIRQVVGETAKFNAVIKNTGEIAATKLEIVARCDAAMTPSSAEDGHVSLPDGGILLRVDRLEPGERRTFGMQAQCTAPSSHACARFVLTANGGITAADEACVEILPPMSGSVPGAATVPVANDLRLTITVNKAQTRVGEKQVIYVSVENAGQQTERQVSMRVLLPQQLTPDATQIQPQSDATVLGQEIRFATVAELPPGQPRQYVIPVTPNRTGRVQIRAQVAASSLATPKTVDSAAIDIVSASL